MARTVSMEALERKIEKAQAQVSKTKKQYDAAISVLSGLLDKRDALRKDELIKMISKSNKTYEEVVEFIGGGSEEGERCRKRRKKQSKS